VVGIRPPDTSDTLLASTVLVAATARIALIPGQFAAFVPPTMAMLAGALALRFGRTPRLAWAAILGGALWSLLFNADWLTQTALMAAFSLTGAIFLCGGKSQSARGRGVIAGVGAAAYLLSAFHKYNADFVNPDLSCASEGMHRLVPFIGRWLELPWALSIAPHSVLATEVLLGLSLLFAPRAGLVLAALFHIGLTLTFEPAFPFVMGIAFVAAGALSPVLPSQRRRAMSVYAGCLLCALPVLLVDAPLVRWDLPLRLAMMLWAAVWACLPRCESASPASPADRRWMAAGLALFFVAGLTPYAGTRVQHSAAMLSNLRVDNGCWNHLLVPESVRGLDNYIRVDAASVGAGNPRLEGILTETLWSTNALRSIRQNWCVPELRPIEVEGTFQGVRMYFADLCDPSSALPVGPGSFGGRVWFPNYRRFQSNLPRECSPACMH
jgi:hypothetical protein